MLPEERRSRRGPEGHERSLPVALYGPIAMVLLVALAAPPAGAQGGGARRRPPPPRFAEVAPAPIPGVVAAVIPPADPEGALGGRFYALVDEAGALTLSDVRDGEAASRFRLWELDRVNLGFTRAALWLRIDIENTSRERGAWILTLDYPLLDRIDVYDASSHDDLPMLRLGDRLPFNARVVPHRTFGVPIPAARPQLRLYIRIETESSMQVRPRLLRGDELFLTSTRAAVLFGLAYGVMLLMATYNLFLYFGVGDRSYLYFVVATLVGLLFLASLYGHAYQYLWPNSPALANLSNPLFAALWVAFTALFARRFLEPSARSRAAARVIDCLVGLGVAASAMALVASYRPAMQFVSASAAVGAVALMICGGVVWSRGHRAARFFTIAWIGLGAGTFILAGSRFGLLPDNGLTRHGALIGGVVEMLLLSLALSDKYRLMHVELEGYSKGLEAVVAERTRQLEEANTSLHRLSITDPLTGVANRRHFDSTLDLELRRHRRTASPISLAMVDIDSFKAFNDRHGHQLGDECLQRVAEALRSVAVRATDVVARYGGEELAVLLPDTDAVAASSIADRMLAAVRAIEMPVAGSGGTARTTVSIGVATRLPAVDKNADRLLATADSALYEAKRSGRDRVVVAGGRE